jgi:tetratricopeptide (TPR) repeat protein
MGLAEALDRAGKIPEATAYARRAVAIEPYGSSWFLLGTLLGKQAQLDEAETYLQLALQARPDDGRVHYNLGLLYKLRGDHRRAIDHFGAAHELAPALRENAAWQLETLNAGLHARDAS